MATLQGTELEGRDALVVGGTGNVGFFLVDGFLRAGARVLVPSRSPEKIQHLKDRLGSQKAKNILEVPGDVGSPEGAATTINGPAGFVHSPFPGTGAISVAASAQATLVQAIARETDGQPRVNDVVMHAYLGPQGTRQGSPLAGEQVGDFVAALASPLGQDVHGQTIHLTSSQQVIDALTGNFTPDSTNH
jgi:hypothetical protein